MDKIPKAEKRQSLPNLEKSSESIVKGASNSVYTVETISSKFRKKYNLNVIKLADKSKMEQKYLAQFLKIKILDLDDDNFTISCFPSYMALQDNLDFQFIFSIDNEKNLLSFDSGFIDRKAPFNATDVFEFMYNHALKQRIIKNEITVIRLEEISFAENKNMVHNLERIRKHPLVEQEKILSMENELFSGDHAGKSILRRLNRINYAPIVGSLQVDLTKPIRAGDNLEFRVENLERT